MKISNTYNYQPYEGIINNQPSMTVPDQTLTLRQILDRYARGLPLGGTNESPIFDEEETNEGIDIRTLDLSEVHELTQQRVNELNALKSEYDKKRRTSSERAEAIAKQQAEEIEQLKAKLSEFAK